MKNIFPVCLILLLVACGQAPQAAPTEAPVVATAPPVEVEPTATAEPTEAPVVEEVAPPEPAQLSSGIFENITYSGDIMYFRCEPSAVTFEVTVNDESAATIYFFFRMRDKATGIASQWSNGEEMQLVSENRYGFTMQASAVPDNARWDSAWLQFQFVAVNSVEQRIANSDVFGELVTFMKDCP
ncbi:MAG: hypothetical protein JXB85_10560 [Anaerolineales bacterium]|nr:hypothetical protein [Anaerolineales bacterium]